MIDPLANRFSRFLRVPRRVPALPVLVAALLPCAGANAQQADDMDGEPPAPVEAPGKDAELDKLESDYLDAVVAARQELGDKYLAALQRLQDSLTLAGKLEDALLVKQERERALELLGQRPEVGAVADTRAAIQPVFLRGADASLQGAVKLSPDKGALYAWEKKGTYAEWTLPEGMLPGEYEVVLHCSAAEGEGGSFDVSLDDQALSATIAGEGEWSDWRDLHVGNLNITARGGNVRVTATALSNARLMNLRHLVLGPPGTAEKILGSEKIAPEAGHPADTPKPPALSDTLAKIENARYVPDPANDGDSFLVSDGKSEYTVRLYFVDVPHGDAADYRSEDRESMTRIAEEASYFGIAPSESLNIGLEAAAYVGTLLAGQPFTLYTRMEPDERRSGRFYAMVVVKGKPLSTLLVEKGFARVVGKTTDLPNGAEAADHLQTLKEAEAAAKAARRGAWGKAR